MTVAVASGIEILPFEARYAADFKALNLAWLRRYFVVEPIDEAVLSAPEDLIDAGGAIFFARDGATIVGTCALLRGADGRFELSKMAVTDGYQGRGIGRLLMEAAIGAYRQMGGNGLFLETNHRLTPAIALYESVGFVHEPRPDMAAHYERADVYMVYRG